MKYHSISLFLVTTIFTLTTCTPTDVIDHLGNLSPFHEPQLNTGLVGGLGTGMADDCSLVQVQLVSILFYNIYDTFLILFTL